VGYGDSDKPAGADYSIPSQAEQVVALADALGIGSFGLIGHSRGGQISLQIAAHTAPERVLALVDVAGPLTGKVGMYQRFALGPRIAIGRYVPALYNITHRLFRRSRRLAKLEFSPWFYDIDSVDEDDWWPDVQQATRPGTHVVNYKAGRAIQSHDLSEAIKAISAPTLVIFGEQDSCIPVEEGIMTAAGVPHARLKLLDACGHFPMYEQKDAYLHALHTFLCRHIGQAAST
ncbi:MAG: alpha/beta fold hydrolase, partial [Chloroflexota bacterium]